MAAHIADTSARPYDVSIIVPFLNERENLPQLYDETTKAMAGTSFTYEIILVDDGSNDGSSEWIADLSARDPRVKLIQFTRNFGQTAAMTAGFDAAQGKIYIAMDADNQNDPSDIPHLIAKLQEGYDVVSGWRRSRQDKMMTRKVPSMVANRLISKITGVHLHDYGCSLKAYRAEFIDSIQLYGEMHRFIPVYANMAGARVAELPVNHRARTRGHSKYGLKRIFKVMVDLLTVKFLLSYATKPSYLFGGAGLIACFLGILCGVEVLVQRFVFGTFAHRNPVLLLAVFLFMTGMQLLMMGLVAELLMRTYHESQGKQIYLVKKTVNCKLAS